ncbi:ergosterol biosynthesis ERG4/ERG24 [Polychytrium aggregatum]|uniref:ergosterol biosynthesis ERG4/ERG24 n=1 Tax=Polychytrium aggregatum TaxID=110093 RepID=UPI0022FE50AD|nr:ergosterol biosynthesis ERG4/ERG24 [Polychytrium aggregatum]KAI9197402.1 ergosterol biosynthesis ERG4/ERG24 [Polychytrium aggregatum]
MASDFGLTFLQVAEVYLLCVVLHKIIPYPSRQGYCCSFDGKPLTYKLNGLWVLFVVVAFYVVLVHFGVKDATFLARNFWFGWLSGALIGLALSILYDVLGRVWPPVDAQYLRCLTRDMVSWDETAGAYKVIKQPLADPNYRKKSPILDFFNGHAFNPRFLGIDMKMMLYCWGAVLLQLNVLSMMMLQIQTNQSVLTNAMVVYVIAFTWFLVEYSFFENVHLYTYDLFAEKIGFKLLWGCLGFYPFLYCIGGIPLMTFAPAAQSQDADIPVLGAVGIGLLFLVGWVLTRGPNMQKFHLKMNPTATTFLFGLIPQKTIPGTRIICSGFWSLSRHINYLGEIIQAIALALPGFIVMLGGGHPWYMCLIPWIYPLYYVMLFIPRERDDNRMCHLKYGEAWETYCKMTPWRIIPYIY